MKRRNFIQMLAATGMTARLPLTANKAFAATPDHFLVIVNAGGGWDPTSLCDPKGYGGQYATDQPSARNGGSRNSVDISAAGSKLGIQWSGIPIIDVYGHTPADETLRVRKQSNTNYAT